MLAGIEITVLSRTGLIQDRAIRIIKIRISDVARAVCQRARGAKSIVMIIADVGGSVLADEVIAVGIDDLGLILFIGFVDHLSVGLVFIHYVVCEGVVVALLASQAIDVVLVAHLAGLAAIIGGGDHDEFVSGIVAVGGDALINAGGYLAAVFVVGVAFTPGAEQAIVVVIAVSGVYAVFDAVGAVAHRVVFIVVGDVA